MKLPTLILGLLVLSSPLAAQIPHGHPGQDNPEYSTAITDGNPQATTAAVAQETATAALPSAQSLEEDFAEPAKATDAPAASGEAAIDYGVGAFEIGGTKGEVWSVRVPYSRKLSSRATFGIGVPISFTKLQQPTGDSQIFGLGLNAGYSYSVFTKADGKPYRWKITPSAGLFFRDCSDLDVGSWVFNAGVSSSFAWQPAPGWICNLGNSVSATVATAAGGRADPAQKDQVAFVNGLQVIRQLDRWSINGYIVDTRFANDALVDSFQTFAAGFGYRVTQTRSFRMLAIYERGNANYSSWRLTASSSWRF